MDYQWIMEVGHGYQWFIMVINYYINHKLDMAYHGLSMFISFYIKVMQVVDLTQSTEPQRAELYRDIW